MKTEGLMIYASVGQVLRNKVNGDIYGESVGIGYIYYANDGSKIEPPILLNENTLEEVDDPTLDDITAEMLGLEGEYGYADVKAAVVKMHYSYDDQIALILNYEEEPEVYEEAYMEMQHWRDIAARVAKRIMNER